MQRQATSLKHDVFPAIQGSYDSSRLGIQYVIIHTMDGFLDGTANWFSNPNRTSLSSAHYGIGLDGRIQRYVDEDKTAYHAGNYSINQQSIGIEHEDNNKPYETRTDTLYNTSAQLIADICTFYNIPIDRNHIRKHNEVSQKPTACPASLDIDRLVSLANALVNKPAGETVKNYQMPEATFLNMVTEGKNFKEVLEYVNPILGDAQRLNSGDPGAGQALIRHLEELITVSKGYSAKVRDLEGRVVELTNQIEAASSAETSPLEVILDPQDPPFDPKTVSTPPQDLLFQPQEGKGAYSKSKPLSIEDATSMFGRLLRYFLGK